LNCPACKGQGDKNLFNETIGPCKECNMPTPIYHGICLGGPNKGQVLQANHPTHNLLGLCYHYVPLFGHQGFWLWEEECKGSMPYEDIMRLLMTNYIERHTQ
jgi:hypothetical protein